MSITPIQPRVIQSCGSRFHHFDLAFQLERHGLLERFYTGYPRIRARQYRLPFDRTEFVTSWELVQLGMRVVSRFPWKSAALDDWIAEKLSDLQDNFTARHIRPGNIFVGLSGSCARTAQRARELGVPFICDRGSSHIRSQNDSLVDEHRKWGVPFRGVDPRRIAKEEAEYALASAITVPSGFAVRSFLDRGVDAAKVRQISYGVDLKLFTQSASPPADRFEVIFVGQVGVRKGIPYLLEAFRQFRHRHKRLRVIGAVQENFKPWLAAHTQENVEFLGPRSHLEMRELLSRSHALVLPSIEEGLALVIGEALACGLPVIASRNTGADDLFTDGREGLIVPTRDSGALTGALEQLAGDPARRQGMSDLARERVKQLGGWDTYGNNYAALVREIQADHA